MSVTTLDSRPARAPSRRRTALQQRVLRERTALVIILIIYMVPVLWLVATAYKPPKDMFSSPPTFIFEPTLHNFRRVFEVFDVWSLLKSSIIISLGSAVLSLLLGVPAGYALARSQSRYAIVIAYFFLAIRIVPIIATLIPFYLMMRDIGLLGTWWAVILVNTTLNCAFVTWMMFSYFRSLPKDMEEAALTDGCTLWGAFWRVALPTVIPGIIASALFCVMFSWNDFLVAMFLTNTDSKPLSVALLAAFGTKDITWGTLGALAHFSTIPIMLMALFLNRYFIQGVTRGVN
ncbi:ABC-type glycerol-3-phosphate transport system permease component [Kaistia hirudinis]|uniref:ABC-type glycerol-3-phosphate transport system permease component n=2 Tax=Kaistia hirudinis TaxID=1293440 RepID=A0A840AVA0_9HYPH|nr:ABC-type glycerol-3-phosphate transport system permease component [Kaistia hirudinis]